MPKGSPGKNQYTNSIPQEVIDQLCVDLGIEAFEVLVHRRPLAFPGQPPAYAGKWDGVEKHQLSDLKEWCRTTYKGGYYELHIRDANRQMAVPIVLKFSVEEEKQEQSQPPSKPPVTEKTVEVTPTRVFQRREDEDDDRGGYYRSKTEALERELVRMREERADERRRLELEIQRKEFENRIESMNNALERRMGELQTSIKGLADNPPGGKTDASVEMMKMQVSNIEAQHRNNMELLKQGIESQKLQMEREARGREAELALQKQYLERAERLTDPGKRFDFMDRLAEQQVSTMNLLQQVMMSKLMGDGNSQQPPAWLVGLKGAGEGLKGIFNKWVETQERVAVAQARSGAAQPPVLPPAQRAATPQPQQPPQAPPPQAQYKPGDDIMEHPVVKDALGHILAILRRWQEVPPEKFAEAVYVDADYLSFRRLMPDIIKDLWENPEPIFQQMPMFAKIEVPAEYIKTAVARFKAIVEENKAFGEKLAEKDKADGGSTVPATQEAANVQAQS